MRLLYCVFDLVVCDSTLGVASEPCVALRVSSLRVVDEWFESELPKAVSGVRTNSPKAVHCGFDGPIAAVSGALAVVDGLTGIASVRDRHVRRVNAGDRLFHFVMIRSWACTPII